MNRAERPHENDNVETDCDCSEKHTVQVICDIFRPGLDVALLRVQNESCSSRCLGPLLDCLLQMLFKAQVCLFIDLTVPRLSNEV